MQQIYNVVIMKNTSVPKNKNSKLIAKLSSALPSMTPEIKKAATYIIENANEIGVSSIREIAQAADVKPNTLVRMARAIDVDGYEAFRKPFRDAIKSQQDPFPDRARWLQSLGKGGKLARLYSEMATASISNIEKMYQSNQSHNIKLAADDIVKSRKTYILGVGMSQPLAQNFAYSASIALENIEAIPNNNSLPIDAIAKSNSNDVLIVMSFKPYRNEIIQVVEMAKRIGMTIIGISESLASPIASLSKHKFVVPVDTSQFFTSSVALSAFLETLLSFVIADASATVIVNIERFHQRRHQLGVYYKG